jgi:hypothetical protein
VDVVGRSRLDPKGVKEIQLNLWKLVFFLRASVGRGKSDLIQRKFVMAGLWMPKAKVAAMSLPWSMC